MSISRSIHMLQPRDVDVLDISATWRLWEKGQKSRDLSCRAANPNYQEITERFFKTDRCILQAFSPSFALPSASLSIY